MNLETYAKCTEAAHRIIETCAVAYFTFDKDQAHRHQFSAEEAMKKIADALGFDLVRREPVAAPVKASSRIIPRGSHE